MDALSLILALCEYNLPVISRFCLQKASNEDPWFIFFFLPEQAVQPAV